MKIINSLVASLTACAAISLLYGCDAKEVNLGPKTSPASSTMHPNSADEVWKENERVVRNALGGKTYSIDKFGAACGFFETTTGIVIRGNGSFFGWLPDQDTATDFKKVEEWYAVNRDRLYWDEASKSVRVRKRNP
jgi:hypothetical protein